MAVLVFRTFTGIYDNYMLVFTVYTGICMLVFALHAGICAACWYLRCMLVFALMLVFMMHAGICAACWYLRCIMTCAVYSYAVLMQHVHHVMYNANFFLVQKLLEIFAIHLSVNDRLRLHVANQQAVFSTHDLYVQLAQYYNKWI